MTATDLRLDDAIDDRLAAVPRPTPVMSRADAAALTERQRELLGELTDLLAGGFSHLTMADLAGNLGCSLRTLYGIAGSRDELVLAACDRNLWATGRRARAAIGDDSGQSDPVERVRRYLHAATEAVSATTRRFSEDLLSVPGGADLSRAHSDYLLAITKELLDIAVDQDRISSIETAVVARALAEVSNLFINPLVIDTLPASPKAASDLIIDLILAGLTIPARS